MLELTKTIIGLHNKHGHSSVQYFEWMLDDCLAAFGKRLTEAQIPPEKVRPIVFDISGKYGQEVVKHAPFFDVLGQIYMELSSQYGKKVLGQFFTPWPIAKMMAQITFDFALYEKQEVVRTADIAGCGSGVLLLAAASHIAENNTEWLKRTSFTGIDLDSICARMFPLQFLGNCYIHGLQIGEILSYRGNGLDKFENLDVVYHVSNRNLPERETPPAKAPVRGKMFESAQKVFRQEDQIGLF